MKEQIRQWILSYGADVCGFANIDRFGDAPQGFSPLDLYHDCKSVICFGIALPKGLTKVDSRLIYGHFNYDVVSKLDEIALRAAKAIEGEFSCEAVPLPSDSPYEYWDEENMHGKGLISLKHAAVNCGLGRLGKSTLLLNPKYGNLLIIVLPMQLKMVQ